MQWAVAAHGPAGKVHADRRTVEYFGRGNHARDAACFRTTRPVSAFPYARSLNTRQRSESQRQQLKQKNAMDKSGAHRGKDCSSTAGSAGGHGSARSVAGADERKEKKVNEDDEDEDVLSLSKLRMFYYETLVVSTRDDDANGFAGEDDSERDARAELDLLMARANAAAAAINSSTSNHHGTVNRAAAPSSITATTPHPYLNARVPGSHLSWRERARRIVHANLRAADSLALENSSSSDTGEEDTTAHEDDDNRMELDSVSAGTVSNNNGHEESFSARSTNGDSGRSFGIRQFLSSTSATSSGTGSNSNRHSRLLSLTSGASELRNSNNTQSRSRSGSNHSSTSTVSNNHGNSNNNNNAANGVHFAFTLSSRTLQQIRSRHERRRMRRHQEKKRFNHRIGVGFVLASKSNRDLIAHDGLSQISTSSTISSHSVSNSSSPLKKLSSYQQQKQVNHDDLGKDSFSLAYHGKTGRIMSNGQVFLQCERFGSGDVVGCGILLDTKTFFFTLNGRLLGMLAATDVHHFDDFVDDGATADGIVIGDDDDEESDVDFEADDESDEESDAGRQREGTLFEDVLYPAVSLHDAGECACANFNEFRFDLAGFERQILKERQQALLLHEITDEREEEANDRVINKLIQDYFLHYGYKDAFTVFQKSTNFSQSVYSSTTMDGDDVVTDMHIDEEEKSEAMDTGNPSSSLKLLSSAQTKLLNLRHAVRQHIYAFETNEALAKVRAALGEAFFLSATKRRRSGKVLFYSRVLCVLDVLLAQRISSEHLAKAKAGNGNGYNGKQNGSRDDAGWNVEEAILCAQDQFSAFLTLTSTRTQASDDSDSIGMDDSEKSSTLAAQSVMDDELELVMSLLLYERKEDVPADSAARKFLSPKFREHVADELNVFLLINSLPRVKTDSSAHQRRRFSPPSLAAAATGKDAFASALQNFLVELNSLQSQCLRNGCRVFPGNHTVSRSGGKRSSSRRRRRHASASSSDNGDGNGDEEMRSSSSGSDMSSSSSRSENDDDDEDDEEEEE